MKAIRISVAALLVCLVAGIAPHFASAQGPQSQPSETVAKPRKKAVPEDSTSSPSAPPATPDTATPDAPTSDQPKIPSKFTKKDKDVPEGLPTFKSDVTSVQLDVAVLSNKGLPIPKIPAGNFRILEDDVPQKITNFNTGTEAPMTVAL